MIDTIVSSRIQKESCDFNIPLRRYGYFCNDTVLFTSANKLHNFQRKFSNVRMAMKDMNGTEQISQIWIRLTFNWFKHSLSTTCKYYK